MNKNQKEKHMQEKNEEVNENQEDISVPEETGLDLSISDSIETNVTPPILPPVQEKDATGNLLNSFIFPKTILVKVFQDTVIIKKGAEKGTEKARLNFVWFDDTKRQHIERFTSFNPTKKDKKDITAFTRFAVKIKHIYEQYMTFPKTGINTTSDGRKVRTVDDMFDAVNFAFNTGREGQPIFLNEKKEFIECWLKLVYNGNYLQLPYTITAQSGFIERVIPGKKCTLSVNVTYDKILPETSSIDATTNEGVHITPNAFPSFYGQ
jgi:hypothetical protein